MSDEQEQAEDGNVEIAGSLARHSSTIKGLDFSPSFAIGRMAKDGREVLLPFFECSFTGRFGPSNDENPVEAVLTFDNVAFLMKRAGEEYVEAMEHFAPLSRGVALSRHRMDLTQRWLEEGAAAMLSASRQIADLIEGMEPNEELDEEFDEPGAATEIRKRAEKPNPRIRRRPKRDAAP